MAIWQWGLLGLGFAWLVQSIGVWLQMQHYSDVFKGAINKFTDGFVGAGQKRGRLGRGTIALVIVSSDLQVRRLLTMSGRTVLARFQRVEAVEGKNLTELAALYAPGQVDEGLATAVQQAIEQIRTTSANARDEQEEPALVPQLS